MAATACLHCQPARQPFKFPDKEGPRWLGSGGAAAGAAQVTEGPPVFLYTGPRLWLAAAPAGSRIFAGAHTIIRAMLPGHLLWFQAFFQA